MHNFFLLFLSSIKKNRVLILIGTAVVGFACGGGDYYWSDFTNINNSSFVPSKYSFFGYNPTTTYDDYIDPSNEDANVSEWKGFLGDDYDSEIISTYLYQKSLGEICEELKSKKKKQNKWISFLNYLIQAKQAEEYGNAYDGWYYYEQPVNIDSAAMAQEMAWQTMFIEEKNSFIKQRLLFQMVKNAFFTGSARLGADYFEKYKNDFPINNMYWRTYGYAAGCYWGLKNYAVSNSMYVKMMSVDRKYYTQAHFSFHPQQESDFQKCLDLCSTKEEKVNAWVLAGLYNDPKRALNEIVKFAPEHEACGLFISRIVSEIEQVERNDWNAPESTFTIDEEINYLKDILKIENFGQKARALAGISYLLYLQGSQESAESFLNKAMIECTDTDDPLNKQLLIFKAIFNSKNIYACTDTELINLQKITTLDYSDYGWSGYMNTILENIDQTLREKNSVLRVFVRPSIRDLNDVSLLQEARKNALRGDEGSQLRKLILGINGIPMDELSRHIAVLLTYDDRITEALAYKQSIVTNESNFDIFGDPFSYRIKDCHDCDHEAYKGIPYSFSSFIDSLQIKESRLHKQENFENALVVGNAFYNISYFGNARLFGYLPWPKFGFHYENADDSWWEYRDYMRVNNEEDCLDKAKIYWGEALRLATNDEERARATFLLSKCELVSFYFQKSPDDKRDFVAGIYFNELLKYKNTKQFQETIQECGYFSSFYSTKK